MRFQPYVMSLTVLTAALACNPFASHHKVGQIDPMNANASSQWNGTLSTPSGMSGAVDITGTASLAAGGQNSTVATVTIANASPKGEHPWHLYRGHCGDGGDPISAGNNYPLLKVANNGTASATATLPLSLPTAGSFYVVVNASETNAQAVVACGNLAPPNAT